MTILRWQLLALLLVTSVLISTGSAQTRVWQSPVDGSYADPLRWSPQDVPDSAGETARFDRFGTYRVSFGTTATTTSDLEITRGEVSFSGDSVGSTNLTILDDARIEGATLLLERNGLPGDLHFSVGDLLSISDSGGVHILDAGSLTAVRTEISAGTNSSATELKLNDNTIASLGDVSLAQSGGGSFDGSLSVLGNAMATVDDLTIASTGATDRRGFVQIFGGDLLQNAGGIARIGSASGGVATVIVGGGGLFSGDEVRIASTGKLQNAGGHTSFASALNVDGGEYIELGAATRAFGPSASIIVANGGELDLVGSPLTLVAGQSLSVSSANVASDGGIVLNGGSLVVLTGTAALDSSVTNLGGTIQVFSGAIAQFNGDYAGDDITGGGNVVFSAGVAPGQSPGVTAFSGDVQWMPSAMLSIEIGGTDSADFDRINVTGDATLAGVLDIDLIEPSGGPSGIFVPAEGDSFTFFTAGDFSGSFASVNTPALFGGLEWRLTPTESSITLSVVAPGLAGDFNYDGTVDAADYTVWRDTQGATGPLLSADADGNHLVDGLDYIVWQNAYGTSSATVFSTPEPASALLALLGGAVLVFLRSADNRLTF